MHKVDAHQKKTRKVSQYADLGLVFTVPTCHGTAQEVAVLHRALATEDVEVGNPRNDNTLPMGDDLLGY